jgi:hypothetical protein
MFMFANCKPTGRLLLVCALSALIAPLAWGPSVAQDDKGLMDEKALGILNQMSDYLGKAQTVSFQSKTFLDIARESGIKIKSGRQSTVYLKRPNHLSINTLGDDGSDTSFWFDGKKLTFWQRDANQVMNLEFSGATDDMLNHLLDEYDIQIPMSDMFYSNINKSFGGDNIVSAEYVGIRIVGGVRCHQLSFESAGADWQIWVEADATPVPRRFVIDFVDDESRPQYMSQMDNWSIDGEIEDFYFSVTMPEGVKQIEFKKQ